MSNYFGLQQRLRRKTIDPLSFVVGVPAESTDKELELLERLVDDGQSQDTNGTVSEVDLSAASKKAARDFDRGRRLREQVAVAPANGIVSHGDHGPAPKSGDWNFSLIHIPVEKVEVRPASRIVFQTDPRGPAANRFRFLRIRLQELWNAGKLRSVLITSPLPKDGKSTVALNLATSLAEAGKRSVLFVEADLYHSSVAEVLNLESRPGLAECIEGGLNPLSALRRIEPLGWYLLSAGKPQGNPMDLLQSESLCRTMKNLSSHFDWIVVDSPPVNLLTDALSLARHADATLLVAREGRTPRQDLEKAIELLGRERVLGIILNGVEARDRHYPGYYGYNVPNSTEEQNKD